MHDKVFFPLMSKGGLLISFFFDKVVTKHLSHYLLKLPMCRVSSVCQMIDIDNVEHQYVLSRWYVSSHSSVKKDTYTK